ncbi:hypothetical protein [Streptomyces sp. NPDC017673]|uniref:hypothetical protein n=1 Tax=unclassified Streptomyces TaxID=2593676 RepID=UPI003787D523
MPAYVRLQDMLFATGTALANRTLGGQRRRDSRRFRPGCCTGPLFAALLTGRYRYAPPTTRTQVFTLGASIKSAFAAGGAALAGGWQSAEPASLVSAVAGCQIAAAVLGALLLKERRTKVDCPLQETSTSH